MLLFQMFRLGRATFSLDVDHALYLIPGLFLERATGMLPSNSAVTPFAEQMDEGVQGSYLTKSIEKRAKRLAGQDSSFPG